MTTIEDKTLNEHDIDILLAALHNHAVKRRVDALDAYHLQVKLLHAIGKEMPLSFEEVQTIAKETMR